MTHLEGAKSKELERKNTRVQIEAHGHLGDFSGEYFIKVGQEWKTAARIAKDFLNYVRKGWEKQMEELFKDLEDLEKIEGAS